MKSIAVDYRDAVEHLPPGAVLPFPEGSWPDYESFIAEPQEPGIRVSYSDGRMEVLSPLPEHENYKDCILGMADAYADVFQMELETRGSTRGTRARSFRGSFHRLNFG